MMEERKLGKKDEKQLIGFNLCLISFHFPLQFIGPDEYLFSDGN